MIVHARFARLGRTQWWEYGVRFAFGGIVTVLTGLVAAHFGPLVGGLFLAFPGIFPSSITLVERHEARKKRKKGLHGTRRGREVAAVVAAGAALGGAGLVAFAGAAWLLLGRLPAVVAIGLATAAWLGVSVGAWLLRRQL